MARRPHLNQSKSSSSLFSDASKKAILWQIVPVSGHEGSRMQMIRCLLLCVVAAAHLSNGRMKHRLASSSVGAQSQRSRRAFKSLQACSEREVVVLWNSTA